MASNVHGHQNALVTCSGQDRQGSLCVIGREIDTQILSESAPEWKGYINDHRFENLNDVWFAGIVSVTKLWSTYISINECQKLACLVASSSSTTKVVLEAGKHIYPLLNNANICADEGLVDVTENIGVVFNEKTIMVDSIIDTTGQRYLLQVHSDGLVIIDSILGNFFILYLPLINFFLNLGNISEWNIDDLDLPGSYKIMFATSWDAAEDIYRLVICISDGQRYQLRILDILRSSR